MSQQAGGKNEKHGREIGQSQQLRNSQGCFSIPLPPINEQLVNTLMQIWNTGVGGILDNSQGWEFFENATAIPHPTGVFEHSQIIVKFSFKWGALQYDVSRKLPVFP